MISAYNRWCKVWHAMRLWDSKVKIPTKATNLDPPMQKTGQVVMRGDSRPRGHGFESQHQILDGHFFTYIVVKIVMFV